MGASAASDVVEVVILDAGSFFLVYPDLVAVKAGGTVTFRNATTMDADLFLDEEQKGLFRLDKVGRSRLAHAGKGSDSLVVGDKPGIYKYQVYMTSEQPDRMKPPQFAKAGSRPSIIIVPN